MLTLGGLWATRAESALAACANPVACENALPGDPPSDWQVQGAGDTSIQGYATSFSVDAGQTVSFKIKTPSTKYHIDILRLGYYGGDGARKIASNITPSVSLPQTQPACQNDSSNGLIDCGNWAVSASWTVPSNAVSGVYIAHLVRDDAQDLGGDSQIPFVVRNSASHSNIVVSTSDATWEAYNDYGGNSLYNCAVACPPGNPLAYKAAYAVSYNRPFDGSFATDGGASYLYYAEYQLIYFLEHNGYDVSYVSSSDVDRDGSLLLNHKAFISSGHDEYWSAGQRANVKAALASGVSLAFFSGNEMFWKTRWTSSADGSNTPYRTLISYKETHFNGPADPQDPPTWTGAWADPRFSPPADGGMPANALTGQEFLVNQGTADLTVPSQESKLRFWRNTAVSSLAAGKSLTLAPGVGTLGYEWDADADNGFRPPGQFDLSSTTVSGTQPFIDYGSTTGSGTETHHLTLYKAPSGALVFGAGTVQWAWGIANVNAWNSSSTDPTNADPDPTMQQATVNLFADMGAQPTTLISGLVPPSPSTDTTPPASNVASPGAGANLQDGSQVTISGSATDSGGGVVAGVEISTDGGTTWHPTTLTTSDQQTVNWTYTWTAHGNPSTTIETRAVDDSGNIETPTDGISVNVGCPCSLWSTSVVPSTAVPNDPSSVDDSNDSNSVEVGLKFKSDTFGQISGIRFYKASTNTGAHIGSLWTAAGQLLSSATFTSETTSGWQTVTFPSPVLISANTTYIAGYFAPKGHYSATPSYFYPAPAPTPMGGATINSAPLHAVSNAAGANGVYAYGSSSTFPTSTFGAANYWVDVMFTPIPPAGQATNVTGTAGFDSATLSWSAPTTGGTVTTYTVTPYIGSTAQNPTTVTGSPAATSVRINALQQGTPYTFTVQASNPAGAGPASAPSSPITPTGPTAPDAPTNVAASPGTGQALVTWTAPASNGSAITGYTVTPFIGSSAQTPVQITNASATSTTVTGLTLGTSYTFTVSAVNGVGTGLASAASPAVTPADTLFKFATPGTMDAGDPSSVELGVKFTADTNGLVTGIQFYKSAANTGTHVGGLWSASGTLLASATFTTETASGWQYVQFSSPVAVNSGTTYIAGYFAPNGHYSASPAGFTSGFDNAPLHAVANGTSPNGVYAYSSSSIFPTNSYNATNYWVDVLFVPAPPGQVTNVAGAPGHGAATVTWSAPATGGASTYTVTPYIGSTAQVPTTVTGTPAPTTATINGLTAGTAYTFTVQASNAYGTGPVSAASSPVTPVAAVAPAAPTNVFASPAGTRARVTWVGGASNGSPITGYTVTPYVGSTAQTSVQVNDGSATSATVTGLTNGAAYTFTVSAINSIGTGAPSAASAAVAPENTIFDFATPAIVDAGDPSSVETGVKFTADVSGSVTGVRFYKVAANAGTHTGSLWSAGGSRLASVTFANETSSGWQYALFASPVSVTAGTTYVVSYFAPDGHYSATPSAFTSAVDSPPLHAVANITSANGVYAYASASTFPVNAYNATSYGVDVLYAPAPPGQVTSVTAAAGYNSARVNWAAPSGGGTVTTYTVTPYVGSTAQTPITVTGSPAATNATLTGLQQATTYTFTVQASNAYSAGPVSVASNSVVPTGPTAPSAPSGVSASPATGQAIVSWTVPNNNGAAITGYTVTPYVGLTAQSPVQVNNGSATSVTVTGLTNGTAYTFQVSATNGNGTSAPSAASSAVTPEDTIFDFATPATIDAGDASSIEVGAKFTADTAGRITGIRFYKAAANAGTHVGDLWSASGSLLASVTFANETAAGWQYAVFSSPVPVTAGTTYVASYFAPDGHYSATSSAFASVFDNPPLHAVANSTSANGVYAYGPSSSFPTSSYNATNYWVDVLFAPS